MAQLLKVSVKSCWRFLSKRGKASSGCESGDRQISQYIFIFSANKSAFSCYINSFALLVTIFESELLLFTFWYIFQRENIRPSSADFAGDRREALL